jgi:hypothetical protein
MGEVVWMSQSTLDLLMLIYKEAMQQGRHFEGEAEKYRLEAEEAYASVPEMKAEGRARAAKQNPRMLPSHERAVDHRTNGFKAVMDAKGDFLLYLGTMASTYANLATMKYSKAEATMAHILMLQQGHGNAS